MIVTWGVRGGFVERRHCCSSGNFCNKEILTLEVVINWGEWRWQLWWRWWWTVMTITIWWRWWWTCSKGCCLLEAAERRERVEKFWDGLQLAEEIAALQLENEWERVGTLISFEEMICWWKILTGLSFFMLAKQDLGRERLNLCIRWESFHTQMQNVC